MEPINRYLDAAILKPEMTESEVENAIRDSIAWKTKTVCVRPCDIPLAKKLCAGTDTQVSCVLAFPHGVAPTEVKAFEAKTYIAMGTDEIDMVANYAMIRSGNWSYVSKDIAAVAHLCTQSNIPLKVIFETCYLSEEQIRKTCDICIECGATFVKTSTGFAQGGATKEAVAIMLDQAAGRIEVKPSGGIRSSETACEYIEMGATRLGTNWAATKDLVNGTQESTSTSGY